MRYPQVYATTVTGGDTVAIIVNWREVEHSDFTFCFEDLGVIPTSTQKVYITDLWTGKVVGTFNPQQNVGVQNIPGHGNFVYKFSLVAA